MKSPEDIVKPLRKHPTPPVQVTFSCGRVKCRCSLKPPISNLGLPRWWLAIRPANQLASQHLWPCPLLFKSLTFSNMLSRLGSIHGARPGSCSFWLPPFWPFALYQVATHGHSTSPVLQILRAIKGIYARSSSAVKDGSGMVPYFNTTDGSSACDGGADFSVSLDNDQAWQMGSQGCPSLGRHWRTCV